MGSKVFANGMGISHAGSGGKTISQAPDVCKTQVGPVVVPLPYTNQAESADLAAGSSTVMVEGNMSAIKGCNYSKSTGDENGGHKGVTSGTIQGIAEFTQYSMDVMIEGQNVCRHNDLTTNNDKNTTGMNMDSSGQTPDISVIQGSWYRFKIVDDKTSEPISGVVVDVTLPDNTVKTCMSRKDGVISIRGIANPGPCKVTSSIEGVTKDDAVIYLGTGENVIEQSEGEQASEPDPSLSDDGEITPVCIAKVTEHKVATDETLDILAQNAGITWQELALFNWGTKDPDEINDHLRLKVGCTNKTTEGNLMFNDKDFPGIIYIPELVTLGNLAEEEEHIFRVKPLQIKELLISS